MLVNLKKHYLNLEIQKKKDYQDLELNVRN